MAMGLGEGSELRAPLAVTVISGLLLATLLTLVVVPVIYTLFSGAGVSVAGRSASSSKSTKGSTLAPGLAPAGAFARAKEASAGGEGT